MNTIIIGTTHSGKTTLAERLKEKARSQQRKCLVISMDEYRMSHRYHCPWCGFDTEIEPWRQVEFQRRLLDDCLPSSSEYDDVIIEGNSMSPSSIRLDGTLSGEYGWADSVVLLARLTSTPNDILRECREHDGKDRYTRAKADTYLLRYFEQTQATAIRWVDEAHGDISVFDTSDIESGVNNAFKYLVKRRKRLMAQEQGRW